MHFPVRMFMIVNMNIPILQDIDACLYKYEYL